MALLKNLPATIDKKTFRNCLILFFALCMLIFGKSISNDYSMDDEFVALNNPQISRGLKAIPEIFRTTYAIGSKASYEYRPLVKVTFAIEHQFFKQNPHISHFINILFYFFAVSLLFYVMLRLLPAYHYVFALAVSLIFLVHPLHSEVVMSLKNRDVMMSFSFCMISLLYYMRFAEGRGKWSIVWGAFFMLMALLSKRDSLTFYAVIPFTIWFFKQVNWKKIVFICVSFLPVPVIFFIASKSVQNEKVRKMIEWENPLFFDTTILHRIPQGFYSIYYYVKMFIIPHPLISYYGYNQVPMANWTTAWVWIVIVVLGIVGYFVVRKFSTKALWIYGVLYFLTTISMFTNVVKPVVGIVGERFAFIPSLGLCIVAAYFIFRYLKIPYEKIQLKLSSFDNKLWIIIGVIVLVFGVRTFARNAAWKDAYTLYKTDVENASESAHLHSLLAASAVTRIRQEPRLSQKEKRELVKEAEEQYLESLRILPNYISSLNNLGMVYYTYLNSPEKAIPLLEKATQLDPGYVEANYNLATSYAALNRYDEAEKAYKRSIELNPDFTASYTSLSNMYAHNKQFDKILKFNKEAIDKGVKNDAPYINIGNVYFMNGDTIRALPYLEKAIEVNWNNKGVNTFLANYYQSKGNTQKASYYFSLLSKIPK